VYAGVTLLVVLIGAGVVSMLVGKGDGLAVWYAALAAYGIQLGAFALLLYMRNDPNLFLSAWLGGMVIRFAVLGAAT
jgi:hypothetical protein